jgi:SnoaL-like domain
MAQSNQYDPARLERLERRLQVLEDAEAIRNLKARYAALCDRQYDADGIAMLFTEDALWESPGLGRFEGREAIRNFFRGASAIFPFAIHYSLNGHIEVSTAILREHGGISLCLVWWPPEIGRCGVLASITKPTHASTAFGCFVTNDPNR